MENNPKLRQHKTETSGEAKANQFPKTPILTFQILLHKKNCYISSNFNFLFLKIMKEMVFSMNTSQLLSRL